MKVRVRNNIEIPFKDGLIIDMQLKKRVEKEEVGMVL
jgi:hypothetical protein